MAPKLYMIDRSPPARSVMLTAKALGIDLDIVRMDFTKGEHLTPKFLKMNPQHTVPTLDDDGKIIWDSHAINVYLVIKYGKDYSLYPKDHHKRAIVDQRLHFNSGVMYANRKEIIRPLWRKEFKSIPTDKAEAMLEGYGFLEKFLEGHNWIAGDSMTVADLCFIPTVTFNALVVPIDEKKFPNITAWIKRVQALPYYHINEEGLEFGKQKIQESLNG